MLEIIKAMNWMDFLAILLFLRIIYVAARNQFVIELFKLLGVIFSVYVSLHYFVALSDAIRLRIPVQQMPLEFLDFVVFLSLAVAGYLIFVLIRSVICHFFKMDAADALNKWGGFILGVARGFLTVSLIIFMLGISSISYLDSSVKKSYLGRHLVGISISAYSGLWNGLMSKFMANEKFNEIAPQVKEKFGK